VKIEALHQDDFDICQENPPEPYSWDKVGPVFYLFTLQGFGDIQKDLFTLFQYQLQVLI
jgi:hypothetical protein